MSSVVLSPPELLPGMEFLLLSLFWRIFFTSYDFVHKNVMSLWSMKHTAVCALKVNPPPTRYWSATTTQMGQAVRADAFSMKAGSDALTGFLRAPKSGFTRFPFLTSHNEQRVSGSLAAQFPCMRWEVLAPFWMFLHPENSSDALKASSWVKTSLIWTVACTKITVAPCLVCVLVPSKTETLEK